MYKGQYAIFLGFAVVLLLLFMSIAGGSFGREPQEFFAGMSVLMFFCVLILSVAVHTAESEPDPPPKPDGPPSKSMTTSQIIAIVVGACVLIACYVWVHHRITRRMR